MCRQLGYDFGSVASESCESYGLHDLCGAPGSPVAVKSLRCTGDELSVSECAWSKADEECASHKLDSVVYCGRNDAVRFFVGFAARLLNFDGAPTVDGTGRLETFVDGAWSPVCRIGFGSSTAAVACKSMGYAGVATEAALPCKSVAGQGSLCGSVVPRVGSVTCSGTEATLAECAHEFGDDVICAPEASRYHDNLSRPLF